ncbi:MAG TPA: hypothetical protein VIZ43_13430 [Trebonia sp.]
MNTERPSGSSSTSADEEVPTARAELHIVLLPVQNEPVTASRSHASQPHWWDLIVSQIRAITEKISS